MIEIQQSGFEVLEVSTAAGTVKHEFDLFKMHSELIELSGDNIPDSEYFSRIARHLEAAVLPHVVRISNMQAELVYMSVRAKVAEIKKNGPWQTFADKAASTASPSGPIPGIE